MNGMNVWIEGMGVWSPGLPDWATLRTCLRGEATPAAVDGSPKPAAQILAPGERRRAPLGVRLAVEVADQAVAMSGRDAGELTSLFVCAHGDVNIVDYMCRTLAEAPRELSPTRFHNSVHNAAAGYWTIANGCQAASSAASGFAESVGAGLLEAAVQCTTEQRPVLVVFSDLPGAGPLAEAIPSTIAFGCALLLAPERTPAAQAHLHMTLRAGNSADAPHTALAAHLARDNYSARGMPLLEALATGNAADITLLASTGLQLVIHMEMSA